MDARRLLPCATRVPPDARGCWPVALPPRSTLCHSATRLSRAVPLGVPSFVLSIVSTPQAIFDRLHGRKSISDSGPSTLAAIAVSLLGCGVLSRLCRTEDTVFAVPRALPIAPKMIARMTHVRMSRGFAWDECDGFAAGGASEGIVMAAWFRPLLASNLAP